MSDAAYADNAKRVAAKVIGKALGGVSAVVSAITLVLKIAAKCYEQISPSNFAILTLVMGVVVGGLLSTTLAGLGSTASGIGAVVFGAVIGHLAGVAVESMSEFAAGVLGCDLGDI
ncbi:hypothetical protein BST96_04975 [Oceanicoccus sagamiensis]|uniref:Uncharacterized protein n=2 Tax=Oceanicoccus sagamiensis TaxID=716816 RepID=A0A1X9N608_9GAMM|nr:hypothetical protein BST96_04975 [Oceanicoccus sagamiensis]